MATATDSVSTGHPGSTLTGEEAAGTSSDVIVTPQSTMEYTSVVSVFQ